MTKRYWALLSETKGSASLGVLLSVLTAFSAIALLAVSGWFISAAAIAGAVAATAHTFNFFTPGAVVRGLSISRTVGRYAERMVTHEATFQLITRLRAQLFNDLAQQKDISRLTNRHESASRLMQDIKNVEGIYLHALIPALTAAITAISYLVVCWMFLPSLAILALPIILVSLILLPWAYARTLLSSEEQLHHRQNLVWSRASAVFSSLRLLSLHGRLFIEGAKVRETASEAAALELTTLRLQAGINLLGQILLAALQVLSLGLALSAYMDQSLNGALVFMLLLLTLGSSEIFAATAPAIASLRLGQLALGRLETLTESNQSSQPGIAITEVESTSPAIRIDSLGYQYPESRYPVFSNLNLLFETNHWYWFKAPSGWGKTTLFGLLSGELQATQGQLAFEGINTEDLGYMPQKIQILRASLRSNLRLYRNASDEQIWQALKAVQLAGWAENLPEKLDTWLGDGEWQPSGGELKRIGLARLILQNPDVIILDEPFAGMDSQLQAEVLQQLRTLWQDRILLIASHDLGQLDSSDQLLDLKET